MCIHVLDFQKQEVVSPILLSEFLFISISGHHSLELGNLILEHSKGKTIGLCYVHNMPTLICTASMELGGMVSWVGF